MKGLNLQNIDLTDHYQTNNCKSLLLTEADINQSETFLSNLKKFILKIQLKPKIHRSIGSTVPISWTVTQAWFDNVRNWKKCQTI